MSKRKREKERPRNRLLTNWWVLGGGGGEVGGMGEIGDGD